MDVYHVVNVSYSSPDFVWFVLCPQESILQKVVMTAFADRTVVTIAVSVFCYDLRLV